MFVVGLDVGYSNLKIAAGDAGDDPRVTVRPAGAAPLDRLSEPVRATPGAVVSNDRPILVDVAGVRWAAAIEPERFEGWQRPLHEDYAGPRPTRHWPRRRSCWPGGAPSTAW